jgi:nucleotide-binding universal stress UspA family protein
MKKSKSVILAEDLKDENETDKRRGRITRAWARFLAQKQDSTLNVATAVDFGRMNWNADALNARNFQIPFFSRYKATEEGRLKKVAGRVSGKAILLDGEPAHELLNLAKPRNCSALVLGTHGFTGAKRLFLGSVAEEIIRHADVPTFVVGPKVQDLERMPPSGKSMNIILATDMGRGSRAAESYAIEFAKKSGAKIILVHCVYQGQDPMLQMALNSAEGARAVGQVFDQLLKDARTAVKRKCERLRAQGIECESVVDTRSVFSYRSVLKAADKFKGDMIVMGTHGRTLFGKAFFGSTTRQTILLAPCPVLVVKSYTQGQVPSAKARDLTA